MTKRKTDKVDQMVDSALTEILLLNLPPVSPDQESKERMLRNILHRAGQTPEKTFCTVRSNEGEWVEIMPGIHRKQLFRNEKTDAALYRMEPGSSFPAHDHASDEECVCLEGEVKLGAIAIKAGDFHLAPQGLRHQEIQSSEGCLLYIRCATV